MADLTDEQSLIVAAPARLDIRLWERANIWVVALGLFILELALTMPFFTVPIFWDGLWLAGAAEHFMANGLKPIIAPAWDAEAHPILLQEILAGAWLAFGQSLWVTHLVIAVFASALLFGTYRVGQLVYGQRTGMIAVALLLCYPLFRAQSTVLVLDLPAAAFAIMAVVAVLRGKTFLYLAFAGAMVLTKETSVLLIISIDLYLFVKYFRRQSWGALLVMLTIHSSPILLLAGWLWYHAIQIGWLTTPEVSPMRLLAAYLPPALFSPDGVIVTFVGLVWDFLIKQFLIGILTFLIVAYSLSFRPVREMMSKGLSWRAIMDACRSQPLWRAWGPPENLVLLGLPIMIHLAFMASNYGVHRYLLPEYPLFFVLAARAIEGVFKRPRVIALATTVMLAIFIVGWSQPWFGYSLASPSNMMYLDFVETHQAAAAFIERNYPNARVLTGWPQYIELGLPGAGYVEQPIKVVAYPEKPPQELRIAALGGTPFTDPQAVTLDDFDLLYFSENTFAAVPTSEILPEIARRYHLPVLAEFRKNGERVVIYANPRYAMALKGAQP
jgi:hypothetical protein